MGHSATARPTFFPKRPNRPPAPPFPFMPGLRAPVALPTLGISVGLARMAHRNGGAMSEITDAELMLKVKVGDIRSFENLVGRHQRPLINYFFRMTWDRQTAEDMAQEVFIRIYNHAKDYEPQAKFTTYMYRVARNLWIDRMRHEGHAPRTVSLDAPVDSEGDTFHDVVSAVAPSPDARMETQERAVIVRNAIETLPEEQKQVLLLAEAKGMKYQEVAEVLGIPIGTVKSRMHAAMMKLKDLLTGKVGDLQ